MPTSETLPISLLQFFGVSRLIMPIHRLFSSLSTISTIDPRPTRLSQARLIAICGVIFFTALGIRLLYWQDNYAGIFGTTANGLQMMAPAYRDHAQRILDDGGLLATRAPADPSDATTLVHPPGYPMLLVIVLKMFHREDTKQELARVDNEVRVVQVICDAFSSVVIFLIAAELLPVAIAIIAAVLSSCSPHFGYYSLMLAPDTLSVLPITRGDTLFVGGLLAIEYRRGSLERYAVFAKALVPVALT